MRHAALVLAVAVPLVGGCSESRADDPNDVRLTSIELWDGAETKLLDQHRFCDAADAADSSCALGPIQLATIDSSGRVFVADPRRIVMLEERTPARPVTRQGDGPGEVRAPFAMRIGRDGTLHVFDVRRMRYLVFGDTGVMADVAALPPMTMVGIRIGDRGLHVLSVPSAVTEGDSVTAFVLRRTTADTTWGDTVARFPERALFRKGGEGMFPPSLPWDRKLLWDVCGRGDVVVASSDEWRVVRYRPGAPALTMGRADVRARSVTPGERDSLLAARLAKAPSPAYRATLSDRVAKPGLHAVIDDLHCGGDGEIYVRNAPPPGATDAQWEVLSDRGERISLLTLPRTFRMLDVRARRLVGVEEAASGAEVIVTARLLLTDTPDAK